MKSNVYNSCTQVYPSIHIIHVFHALVIISRCRMQAIALISPNVTPLTPRKGITSPGILKGDPKSLKGLVMWFDNFQSTTLKAS